MKTIDEYISDQVDSPFNQGMSLLDNIDNMLEQYRKDRPTELKGFKEHVKNVSILKDALEGIRLQIDIDRVSQIIATEIEEVYLAWSEEKMAKIDDVFARVDLLIEEIQNANIAHNNELRTASIADNVVYEKLEADRKELLNYSDKIFDICSKYGITSGDVDIDNNTFTIEQIGNLYRKYLKFLQKEEHRGNPVKRFREMLPNEIAQGVILLVFMVLCMTQVLDILSIVFFLSLGYKQWTNRKMVNYYTVLMGVVFNVDPMKLGYKDLDESLLLPEVVTDEMQNTDERFSGFESELDAIDAEYESTNPKNVQAQMMNEFASKRATVDKDIKEKVAIFEDKRETILNDVISELNFLNEEYERLKAAFQTLGKRFSMHYTFDTKFVFGIHDDVEEEIIDIGPNNVIIRPYSDEAVMNRFLQCMVANAFSNTFPGKLIVHVYDPNNFGRSLMPLFNQDLNKVMIFYNQELNKLIAELTDYAQANFKDMQGKDLQTFNKECEETGKTSKLWQLLIILSQPKTVEEDEALNAFFEYSASGGVMIWTISDKLRSEKAFTIRKPFEGIKFPFDFIDDNWCIQFGRTFFDKMDKAKPKALFWTDFINAVVPEDKIWTGSGNEYIEMHPGYLNGDPSSYKPYTVGNEGNVHAIGVGGTGAGKSVFLNHLVATMTRLYSPNELELWMCDFKGVEFKFYLPTQKTGEHGEAIDANGNPLEPVLDANGKQVKDINDEPIYKGSYKTWLPHIKACLCTSDADYATSLFKAIRNMADQRYEDMKSINVKNMPGWNQYWRKKIDDAVTEEERKEYKAKVWPRVLFICDEFQVIFEKADPKNLDSINADITQLAKVARAAGVHIFFTSQSMKKTISADILQQFSLRFALRCDKEVSMDILGTPNAGLITEKNGFLYVRSVEMTLADQKRYRTPFIEDKNDKKTGAPSPLRRHVNAMYERAVSEDFKFKDIITYQESTKHSIQELINLYKDPNVVSKLPENGMFFLGPRMAYSPNKAPDNIILGAKNNSHIISVFSDYTDFVLFFNTIVTNINCNKVPGSIVINTQVDDLSYICEAENYITNEKHKSMLSSKTSCVTVINWIKDLVEHRKAKGGEFKPVWCILLGWDKGQGFGVDPNPMVRNDFNILLQTAAEYRVHIIMIQNSTVGMASNTIGGFNYRIAGKCGEDASLAIIGTRQASKLYDMATGWLFSWADGKVTRDKLYKSEIKHEIQASELIL